MQRLRLDKKINKTKGDWKMNEYQIVWKSKCKVAPDAIYSIIKANNCKDAVSRFKKTRKTFGHLIGVSKMTGRTA